MLPRTYCFRILAATLGVAVIAATSGCPSWSGVFNHRPATAPLGTLSDPVWQNQEYNAEKSDFVIHEHEFVDNTEFLNTLGEDHLKQIAYRLSSGHDAHVIVERSKNFARPETEYKYRVHTNPEMDMRRRDVVVRCLMAMKIADADNRVLVAPDLAPVWRAGERAATDYSDNFGNTSRGAGLGGGGDGGWGGGDGGWGGGWGGGGGGWGGGAWAY